MRMDTCVTVQIYQANDGNKIRIEIFTKEYNIMSTLAVKLPITRDDINGYTMIDDVRTLVKQNFKMLVLTNLLRS